MPSGQRARILIADDDESIRFMVTSIMKKEGYVVDGAADGDQAVAMAADHDYDLIILDVKMPGRDGLEALRELRSRGHGAVVVMITAHGAQHTALEAIKAGAYDYFSKPFELDEFRIVIRRALERRELESQLRQLQSRFIADNSYGEMVGQCRAMRDVYRMIEQVAPSDATVLIRGESGTGKELVARELHRRSSRQDKPFVSINCAAIPENLLESELFGHERGAFTGAVAAKPGRFEVANGGTIFLDEIGDMPILLQTKLLRVLQEREIERVGGTRIQKVDIRVVAATNQDLEKAVIENRFRQDLFFRLNVIPILLPALRERVDDLPLLTQHFVSRFNAQFGKNLRGVDDEALRCFVEHDWPGNIRELENVIQRAVILARGDHLRREDLPPRLRGEVTPTTGSSEFEAIRADDAFLGDFSQPLSEKVAAVADRLERRAIQLALEKTGGRREETAELLGLSRKSLYNKMQKFGLGEE